MQPPTTANLFVADVTVAEVFLAEDAVPFERAWRWQRGLQARLLADPLAPEALLLLQHEPCYTLGRGASLEHLHFDPAAPPLPLHRIDRGGEVTHHAPGQLVLYPVLDLRRRGADLHLYLRQLEQVVIDLLAELGLRGERVAGRTGVWLEGRKVAAIGVGARRWISQHGLALNVEMPLDGFAAITPCGLSGLPVGRLSDWRPNCTAASLAPELLRHAARCLDLELEPPRAAAELDGLADGPAAVGRP
jgi:lipoyl(octanoyl) transferase